METRFVLIDNNPAFPNDGESCWWWDMTRPYKEADAIGPYIAVQCYVGKNPNEFVHIDRLYLLFTDQAEYYAVCETCYFTYYEKQWSGSTSGGPNWWDQAKAYREKHQTEKGWCEFCDPIFGNGGWL